MNQIALKRIKNAQLAMSNAKNPKFKEFWSNVHNYLVEKYG